MPPGPDILSIIGNVRHEDGAVALLFFGIEHRVPTSKSLQPINLEITAEVSSDGSRQHWRLELSSTEMVLNPVDGSNAAYTMSRFDPLNRVEPIELPRTYPRRSRFRRSG